MSTGNKSASKNQKEIVQLRLELHQLRQLVYDLTEKQNSQIRTKQGTTPKAPATFGTLRITPRDLPDYQETDHEPIISYMH